MWALKRARTSFARSNVSTRPTWSSKAQKLTKIAPENQYVFSRDFSYNYNYNANGGNRSSFGSRISRIAAGLALFSAGLGMAYYLYWPKHTFPSSVAKILRRGLWAESDKGENDYQLALKHYIEALQQCQELNMDPLSDEYTGIQLKIGEMYERMNMSAEANLIYNEIATLYLKVLSAETKGKKENPIPEDLKNHLIQKDLRIVIKLVELNKSDLNLCKAILFTHSIIPNVAITKCLENNVASFDLSQITPQNNPYSERLARLKFIDEFINLTNMLIAINISLGDYSLASSLNVNLTKLMLLSNASPDKVLISQCNLGSLLYLQNEQFELNLINLFKSKNLDFTNVIFNQLAPIDPSKPEENPYADSLSSPQDLDTFNVNLVNCKQTLALSIEAYENVLKMATNLINRSSHTNNTIPKSSSTNFGFVLGTPKSNIPGQNLSAEDITKITEIISLSTYSLGVTNLHLHNYDKAERYLREARVKCKSCDYKELLGEIERESEKVFAERKRYAEIESVA